MPRSKPFRARIAPWLFLGAPLVAACGEASPAHPADPNGQTGGNAGATGAGPQGTGDAQGTSAAQGTGPALGTGGATQGTGGAGGTDGAAIDGGDRAEDGSMPGDAREEVATPDGAAAADARPRDAAADRDDGAASDASTPVTCPSGAFIAGTRTVNLQHGGVNRSFIAHLPAGYDNTKALPLVLNFHGLDSTSGGQETLSRMDAKADTEGFIVVYPQGTSNSWNGGACCGNAAATNVDDVGFARAIVALVQTRACVDAKRVFAIGFSNGGRMAYRLGCQAADLFAAIAPVAGTKSFPDLDNGPGCNPSRPIPLLDIVGTADPRLAVQSGQVSEWIGVDGCTDATPMETYRQGQHVCRTYSQCKAGTNVTFCTVNGVDHTWPNVTGFSTNDRVWDFLKRFSL